MRRAAGERIMRCSSGTLGAMGVYGCVCGCSKGRGAKVGLHLCWWCLHVRVCRCLTGEWSLQHVLKKRIAAGCPF